MENAWATKPSKSPNTTTLAGPSQVNWPNRSIGAIPRTSSEIGLPNSLSSFLLFVGPSFQFAASAVVAVQPSSLAINLTLTNTVLLTWPAADTLGQLQTAPDLNTAMTNVPTASVVIGTNQVVELPATQAHTFFRLVYP